MATKVMQEIAEKAVERWTLNGVSIQHRIGIVPVTEESVNIVALSAHRKEGMLKPIDS